MYSMTYVSPIEETRIEEKNDDAELRAMDKESQLTEERFNFSMFFILGIILLLIGFFRMIVFRELSYLSLGFVVAGFAVSLGSQHWIKKKEITKSEHRLIDNRKDVQYEIQAADFGFTDQIHRNEERDKYEEKLDGEKIEPDVEHKKEDVDYDPQTSFDPPSKLDQEEQ